VHQCGYLGHGDTGKTLSGGYETRRLLPKAMKTTGELEIDASSVCPFVEASDHMKCIAQGAPARGFSFSIWADHAQWPNDLGVLESS
jgi:hypothetical protein